MSRERILDQIRATLDAGTARAVRRASATQRLAQPVAHPRPQRAMYAREACLAQFKAFQRQLGVDLIEVDADSEIPAAVAGYLRALGLPPRLRRASDPRLAALPWSHTPEVVADVGTAREGDTVGLSRAVAAAAETGTLVLASGPGSPVTLGLLPETHIVVLAAEAIVGSYEEACALALAATDGAMPRTLNLVTGASRTGDIGGQIVKGAHGPRRLAVVLVGEQR